MAGLKWTASSGIVAIPANTAIEMIQVTAPTNQAVLLESIRFMGQQAAGGTDAPLKCRFTRNTAANKGTGTSTGTFVPHAVDPHWTETIQAAVQGCSSVGAWTGRPTSVSETSDWYLINPQSGLIEHFDRDRFRVIPGGNSLNVEVTTASGQTASFMVNVTCEE